MTTTHALIAEAAELIGTSDTLTLDEFNDRLMAWVASSSDKLFALRCVHAQLEGRAEGLRQVEADYAAARAATEAKAIAVKNRAEMLFRASVEIGNPLPGGRIQPNSSASLQFTESFSVAELPREFVQLEPNKAAIREALRAGRDVPGCVVVTGSHFRWTVPR